MRAGRLRDVLAPARLTVLGLGILLAGCGAPAPSSGLASPIPVPSDAGRSPVPSAAGSGVAIPVDPALLAILPADLEGASLVADAQTAAGIAADPALAADIEGLAVGLYAGEADYAVVTVARLRPGIGGEGYFRDWRDSFDDAVCAQAGGVDGHAQAEIGGRTAYIGTCTAGVRTYHVRLAEPDRIVSLQTLGEGRYGELILAGLTE